LTTLRERRVVTSTDNAADPATYRGAGGEAEESQTVLVWTFEHPESTP
jgi:hypothetical protein